MRAAVRSESLNTEARASASGPLSDKNTQIRFSDCAANRVGIVISAERAAVDNEEMKTSAVKVGRAAEWRIRMIDMGNTVRGKLVPGLQDSFEKLARPWVGRTVHDLLRSIAFNNAAIIEECDTVSNFPDESELMRDDDHCHS